MEIDHSKSPTTEDQMEMMLMNSDFYGHDYHDVVSSDHHEFSTTTISNTSAVPEAQRFVENFPCSFMSLPNTTISFSSDNTNSSENIIQASFSNDPRWRGGGGGGSSSSSGESVSDYHSHKRNSMAAMREMIFLIAAMQPINIDPDSVKLPKRRNVKISQDPQSVAARHRRERISERIRILRRLVPGGTKMDTASMLDEAIHYVKFLKNQVQSLQRAASVNNNNNKTISTNSLLSPGIGFAVAMSNGSYANHHRHQPPPPPPPAAAAPDHPHHQGLQRYGAALNN